MDHIQHFELPYKSRDRAKKFYFDSFDWQMFDLPAGNYTLANTVDSEKNGMPKRAGAINGALVPRSDTVENPTMLIKVGDVDAALGRIRRFGGTILGDPWAMGPVYMARFRDPEGNVMAVFEDRTETPSAPAAKAGSLQPGARQLAPAGKAPPTKASKVVKKAAPKPAKATRKKASRKAAAKKGRKKR